MAIAPLDSYVDPDRVPYARCPLCASEALTLIGDADWTWKPDYQASLHPVIRWLACAACDHQITWGYHTPEALDILLGSALAGQTAEGMTATDIEAARYAWAKVVDAVSHHAGTGRWLDVGAGAGMLAAVAAECGYDVVTMELRAQVAEALHARGFTVLREDVTELLDGHASVYDVISMCDVLEHVPFPRTALQAVSHALREDGMLFVSCPNRDSLAWRALDAERGNPYWAEIEHYHNFSFRRLRTLLVEHGFEVLSCSVSNRHRVCMDVVARRRGGPVLVTAV